MADQSHYSIYRRLVTQLLNDQEQLPSLPAITLEIRRALGDNNINTTTLVRLISRDPALSALLMKHASSTLYRNAQPPKSLHDVIKLIGLAEVDRITMLHSVKSLFTLHSAAHKRLFLDAWERLVTKASTCAMLARLVGRISAEHALLASLLSEVGSLAILSSFKSAREIPSAELYINLCREFSKSLGVVILKKWAVSDEYIEVIREAGNWQYSTSPKLQLIDLVNLALYHNTVAQGPDADLPPLCELPTYQKLLPPLNQLEPNGELSLLIQHQSAIRDLAQTLR